MPSYHARRTAALPAHRHSAHATARRASLLALAVGLAISAGAHAVNTARTADGDWNDGNWSNGTPGVADHGFVDGYLLRLQTPGTQIYHLYFGSTADSQFEMSGGGTLTTSTATLGVNAGRTGIAILRGAGTSWDIAADIGVGHLGRGELSVLQGAHLYTHNAWVGSMAGSDGFVMVDGVGSRWDAGTIYAGASGNGRVQISNAGTVVADRTLIGAFGGSDGLVVVAMAGSQLDSTQIQVGGSGQGELLVQGGARVQSTSALIGGPGGTGVATVNNTGSEWNNASVLTIGAGGQGNLQVINGGRVSTQGLNMATVLGSGILGIGDGAVLDNAGATATLGESGVATVDVQGQLITGAAILGARSTGSGSVHVTGGAGSWLSTSLALGQEGSGTLRVDNGGTATIDGSIRLGDASQGQGSLVVGSNGQLVVGNASSRETISTGDGTGNVVLAGGVLRNAGWLTVQSTVQVSAASTLDTQGTLGIEGTISGNGLLRKTGAGVLMLSGTNTFDGGLQIEAGTLSLKGSAAAGRGQITLGDGTSLGLVNIGTLGNALRLQGTTGVWVASGDSATLGGTLSGTSSSVLEKNDRGELVLGGGAFNGTTRVNGGTVRAIGNAMPTGNIEIGSAGTFKTDTTRVLQYNGQLSGDGTFAQGRHWLTLTGDSSAFAGTTVVDQGRLMVDGALGGQVNLVNGAYLAGTGRVGSVHLRSGSVLDPGAGQGVGRLTVNGDLVFDPSATYRVDVAADGSSDRVDVTGVATLGGAGTLAVAAAGDWMPATRYTVLNAGGGVDGTFAAVNSNLAFLDPRLGYDANNVYLTMTRNDVSMPEVALAFPDVVVNDNQKAVAGAVEALGNGAAVYDAVVRLAVPEVVPAFDSLSGEIHAAHRGTLLQNRFLHDGIDGHLDGTAASGGIAPGVTMWVAGRSGQRRTDATANSAGSRTRQHGVMAGAGWQIGEAVEVGVAAGQQQLDSRLPNRAARAETDATEYGLYAQYRWEGLRLRAGLSRADYRTESARTAQVGSTLNEALGAREDATGTTAFLRAGWTFGGPRVQLTPELEVAQVRLESDGTQERGGHSALQVAAARSDYRTGLAALKADWDISGGARDGAMLTARVGWQYADGDRLPTAGARFVEGTQGFTIAGTALARRSVLAQVGVAVSPTTNSRVSLQMQGQRGDGQREVSAQLAWSVAF